jgi:hypothetical protein
MKTSQQIAKEIDLKRFLSIVEDLPKIEKRTAYNFDLPINVFGLGVVVCRLVRWENYAKPVLYAVLFFLCVGN